MKDHPVTVEKKYISSFFQRERNLKNSTETAFLSASKLNPCGHGAQKKKEEKGNETIHFRREGDRERERESGTPKRFVGDERDPRLINLFG